MSSPKEFTTPGLAAASSVKVPDINEHQADMARRHSEYLAKRPRLLDCLDPLEAKYHEDRKPIYEYTVEAKLFRRSVGRNRAQMETVTKQVVAHNDNDAWANFCDLIGEWPSRRDVNPTITRGKKRTLRAED